MTLTCSLCKLEFTNEDQLKQHLEGKRHKKLETIRDERENSARRSIFVSNLKKDTFIKQLEEHFSHYGKISKIVTDNEKNAYAIIEYEDEKSVEQALEIKEHKLNGKNLKVSRRELKQFVSKIASSHDKKKELMDKLKEEALTVNTILGKCETFNEQIDKLVEHFRLNENEIKMREEITKKLSDIFSQFWSSSEFRIDLFGSSVTGLACKGSDMDLSILFNQYLIENQHKQLKQPKVVAKQMKNGKNESSDSNMETEELEEDVNLEDHEEEIEHSLKEVIKSFFNDKKYNEFLKFDVEHQIKVLSRIIQRFYYDIKSLKTITNTRCPVVRFHHDKANINCDLSLNNFLAVENSKLLKLYFDMEPELRKLVFVLRYWFKQKNLYSTNKFNSYTIIWMILYYLQVKKIGYLPTVDDLSKITSKVVEIHGWNCAFEEKIDKIKSNFPLQNFTPLGSINDLLKGFFEFYSQFSFNDKIIQTRWATLSTDLKKTDLSKLSNFINIQDPFDLNHNLTFSIPKSTFEKFQLESKGSNELLQYGVEPKRSSTKGWGLILLTTKKSLPINHNGKELIEKSLINLRIDEDKNTAENISLRKAIDFVMFLMTDCLLFEKLDPQSLKPKKRLRVLNQICDRVDSLGLNCSPKRLRIGTSDDPNKPTQTYVCVIDESLNNNGDEEKEESKTLASFYLNVCKNTWQGRRSVKRELIKQNSSMNELDLEKRVSEKLCAKMEKPINFRIEFMLNENCLNEQNLNNLNIKFDLLSNDEDKNKQSELINFTTLVHFLDVYINNCQEKLFDIWNKQTPQLN
ncbi:unnamed protein product [Brachionus calyciflorus]|uniref:Speckle targeted PIP5K1A-regulated poly(A) polymerase n=1 Tax=Brachionus calyciflorus TaxID=104777 RepID=A0A814IE25_9BILA|nr:unnamed protein product [Brachionus calyciflorus]